MKIKRLPCLMSLLAAVLLLCLCHAPNAEAATIVDSGTCGDSLTWTFDDQGKLIISGTGAMSDNSSLTSPWRHLRPSIRTVEIKDGVTSIGRYAFYSCENLTAVTIPDGVVSIGSSAFNCCVALPSVMIPKSVKTIGSRAFMSCGVKDVYITDPSAWCRIEFGDGDSSPMRWAERGHILDEGGNEVTELFLDASIKELPEGAFKDFSNLKSVVLPEGITAISKNAFEDCKRLTAVTIPQSVTSIGNSAFSGCNKLESVTIPEAVTYIGHYAFFKCSKLTSIRIPEKVTDIKGYAFAGCSSLVDINIPDGITEIEISTFAYCSSLTSIEIPNGIIGIGEKAFYDCTGLTAVNIPDGVTDIGDRAFGVCYNLTAIYIPGSVTSIEDSAFYLCQGIKDVYYGGTQSQWGDICIGDKNEILTDSTIHYQHVHDHCAVAPEVQAATCTAVGYEKYTCICGDKKKIVIPALGHNYVDFVCTRCQYSNPGDFNGDEEVTDADALYLLRYTLFPERYPVGEDADVNGDGEVTDADALYLLRYTLFPERYPLYPKKDE